MVRCNVHLRDAGRLRPESFVGRNGSVVAWLDVDGDGGAIALWGSPEDLRGLASAATATAEQAEELQRVAGLLIDAGMAQRLAA